MERCTGVRKKDGGAWSNRERERSRKESKGERRSTGCRYSNWREEDQRRMRQFQWRARESTENEEERVAQTATWRQTAKKKDNWLLRILYTNAQGFLLKLSELEAVAVDM